MGGGTVQLLTFCLQQDKFYITTNEVMAPTKKAILIGINYDGHKQGVLRGCHNDVKNMSLFVESQGYSKENILLLLDTPGAPADKMPTRVNITNGFKWLLKDAKAGDCLFIHYSGHGGQAADEGWFKHAYDHAPYAHLEYTHL